MFLIFCFLLNAVENKFPIEYLEYISAANINIIKRGAQPNVYKRDYLGVEHDDEFILSFDAFNSTIALHLKPSTMSREIQFSSSQTESVFRPRLYSGYVLDHSSNEESLDTGDITFASILISDSESFMANGDNSDLEMSQFSGHIVMNQNTYNIKTIESYNRVRKRNDAMVSEPVGRLPHEKNAQMIIYRSSDTGRNVDGEWSCGVDSIKHSMPAELQKTLEVAIVKRGNTNNGCPGSLKELYIGIVLDCTYTALHGGIKSATDYMLQQMDIVNQLYKNDFNIVLGIIEIVVMDTCSSTVFNVACSDSYTINNRLSDFSKWRADNKNKDAGIWHLFSTCKTDPVVGLAWMSSVCTTTGISNTDTSGNTQYYSGASISTSGTTKNDWVVTAHEIGHNFAAKHDCNAQDSCTGTSDNSCCECTTGTNCDCGGTFIMNPSSSLVFTPTDFSSCTKGLVCTKMPILATCLVEPGLRPLLNLKVCGNGILEEGEECDNGIHASSCCNNCTLTENSQCDDFSHNCCTGCQISPSDKVCRPSTGTCDIADYCDGKSKTCPAFDKHEANGLPCKSGVNKDTYCASGQCTNRDMQCVLHQTSGVSEAIKDWDPITGSCSLFKGQCDLWCDSSKLPCRKLSGNFLGGTKCGTGNGYCNADNQCTDPDQVGIVWEFIANNQVYVIIASVFVLAVFIFSYDALKRRKRRKRRQRKREERQRAKLEYQVEAPLQRKNVSANVDKSYYYEDEYEQTDLYEEHRNSYHAYDLNDDRNSRPHSRESARPAKRPSNSKVQPRLEPDDEEYETRTTSSASNQTRRQSKVRTYSEDEEETDLPVRARQPSKIPEKILSYEETDLELEEEEPIPAPRKKNSNINAQSKSDMDENDAGRKRAGSKSARPKTMYV